MSDTELRDLDEALPSEPDEVEGHGGSDKLYIQIFVLLVVITAAEVSTYVVDFGDLMLPSLMVMMVVKFALVVMFFMHLKFDHKLFTWVFVSGLVLAVLVYIAAITTFEYWQDL
jgi:cytochrome c oxidase subunit 4